MKLSNEVVYACPMLPLRAYYQKKKENTVKKLSDTLRHGSIQHKEAYHLIASLPKGVKKNIIGQFLNYYFQYYTPFIGRSVQHDRIMNILTICPDSCSFVDSDGMTPLHYFLSRSFVLLFFQ